MLILSHIGYTVVTIRGLEKTTHLRRVNYWLIAVAALLPDFVDRTLFVFFLPQALSGRSIAHTLLFNVALIGLLLALRRGWWVYGAASAFHLVLDSVNKEWDWTQHVLWPLLGTELASIDIGSATTIVAETSIDRFLSIVDPYFVSPLWYLALEIGGAAIIIASILRRRARRQGTGPDVPSAAPGRAA